MLSPLAEVDVRPWSRLLRAVADETRLRIVALLAEGELCVCHVEAALALPQPTVSRHLGVLRAAGVVDARRDGTWVYYRLAPAAWVSAAAAARGSMVIGDWGIGRLGDWEIGGGAWSWLWFMSSILGSF